MDLLLMEEIIPTNLLVTGNNGLEYLFSLLDRYVGPLSYKTHKEYESTVYSWQSESWISSSTFFSSSSPSSFSSSIVNDFQMIVKGSLHFQFLRLILKLQ